MSRKIRRFNKFFFHRDHLFTVLLAGLIGLFLVLISVNLTFFNPIKRSFDDFSMTDVYYEILSDNETSRMSNQITIVDVTQLYQRCDYADLLEKISALQPAVVGMDLIFEGHKDDSCDMKLVENLFKVPELVVAAKLTDYDVRKNCFTSVTQSYFQEAASFSYSYVNIVNNMTSHTIRKYSIFQKLNNDTLYSFPTKVASAYLHKSLPSLIRQDNEPYIDYRKDVKFPCVRADSVQYWGSLIKGRIVLLGCMHEEADTHFTPLGKMPGVEIQAYSVLTQMNHRELTQMSNLWCGVLTFVMAYITTVVCFLISRKMKRVQYIAIKIFLFIEMALLVWLGFYCYVHFNYNISLLYPLLAVALTETARFYYANLIMYLRTRTGFFSVRKTIYL